MDPGNIKVCPLCSFMVPSLMYLLKHVREVHAHRPGFCITCCLGGCRKQFRKFEVYRNHVYDFHTDSEPVIQCSTFQDQDDPDHWLNCETDSFNDPEMTSSILYSKKRAAATWILKVQEMYKLPQSTMEQILKDVTGFFQNILMDLHDELKSILSNSGIDHTLLQGFDQLFSANSFYTNPFLGLETQHAQLKYYKESLNFVVRSIIIRYLYWSVLTLCSCYLQGARANSSWHRKTVDREWEKEKTC